MRGLSATLCGLLIVVAARSVPAESEGDVVGGLERLGVLEGAWVAEGDGFSSTLTYDWVLPETLFRVRNELHGEAGKLLRRYQGYYAWDAAESRIVFWTVSSKGELHRGQAEWRDGRLWHRATTVTTSGESAYRSVLEPLGNRLSFRAVYRAGATDREVLDSPPLDYAREEPAGDSGQIVLPEPTGPSPVGTTVWHWIDRERLDEVTPDPGDVREIMAQAWYPAAGDAEESEPAPYAPLYAGLDPVRVWSRPGAPVAIGKDLSENRLPVIVIAPGRGVARHFYTTVAEDLASHGYLVLAIDSPHSGRVRYPDGRTIPPAARYRIPFEVLIGPYEKVDEFFHEAAELGAGDVAFALDRLAELDRDDPARRLTGRLDLSRLGAFGHSLGGRIAGAAVAADPRFAAYASMEGVPPRAARKGGMDAAVLMLLSSALPDMAQPNIRDVIPNRRNAVYVATLEGYGHNSPTDLPLLEPGEYDYEVDPAVALGTMRVLLRAFFDQHVRRLPRAMDAAEALDRVKLEVFEKPSGRQAK